MALPAAADRAAFYRRRGPRAEISPNSARVRPAHAAWDGAADRRFSRSWATAAVTRLARSEQPARASRRPARRLRGGLDGAAPGARHGTAGRHHVSRLSCLTGSEPCGRAMRTWAGSTG